MNDNIRYQLEEDEDELRQAIEEGRKRKIAAEVLCGIFDERKAEIVRKMEADGAMAESQQLISWLAELRVMKAYKDMARKMISIG
ncbi:MAG: hypothetical protein IJ587_08245 [Synergistaceae bacterium]|nr:hypothetical protein [Synergistaceae bacterium]